MPASYKQCKSKYDDYPYQIRFQFLFSISVLNTGRQNFKKYKRIRIPINIIDSILQLNTTTELQNKEQFNCSCTEKKSKKSHPSELLPNIAILKNICKFIHLPLKHVDLRLYSFMYILSSTIKMLIKSHMDRQTYKQKNKLSFDSHIPPKNIFCKRREGGYNNCTIDWLYTHY